MSGPSGSVSNTIISVPLNVIYWKHFDRLDCFHEKRFYLLGVVLRPAKKSAVFNDYLRRFCILEKMFETKVVAFGEPHILSLFNFSIGLTVLDKND